MKSNFCLSHKHQNRIITRQWIKQLFFKDFKCFIEFYRIVFVLLLSFSFKNLSEKSPTFLQSLPLPFMSMNFHWTFVVRKLLLIQRLFCFFYISQIAWTYPNCIEFLFFCIFLLVFFEKFWKFFIHMFRFMTKLPTWKRGLSYFHSHWRKYCPSWYATLPPGVIAYEI